MKKVRGFLTVVALLPPADCQIADLEYYSLMVSLIRQYFAAKLLSYVFAKGLLIRIPWA
jgi:hypothetical protein